MYQKNLIPLFILSFLLSTNLFAGIKKIDANSFLKFPNGKQVLTLNNFPAMKLEVNNYVAREIFKLATDGVIVTNFPLLGEKGVDLSLKQAYIPFDQNTEFYMGTRNGLVRMKAPNIFCLSGKITNEPNSFVFITLTDDGMFSTVQTDNGELYTLAPVAGNKDGEHLLTFSNAQVQNDAPIFECLTEEYNGEAREYLDFKQQSEELLAPSKLLEVKLAVEGTADYFNIFGNFNSASAYMTAVIAQSSKIYEEFINVRLYINYLVIYSDDWEDPYYGTTDLSEKLSKMPSIWKDKPIERALTVLFADLSKQPANSTVAGISYGGTPYYGSLCNKNYGYCVLGIRGNASYPTLNYTWDVNVATHEMGHNFSAPHTHNCYWSPKMIDTCVTGSMGISDACVKTGNPIPRPGTIMSYCHLTNSTHSVQLIFHPRQLPLLRSAASRSSCVKEVGSPYVSLLSPLGQMSYVAGSTLPIRWTSSYVNYVSLYYSTDNGSTWNLIKDMVNTNDSIYYWTLPNVKTTKALVKVTDYSNPNVSDQSLLPFSILPREIIVLTPLENSEYAQGESIGLSWDAALIDTFTVEFSADGGVTFEPIQSNLVSKSLEFPAPAVKSDKCQFRVKSADGKIVALSPLFKIGVPTGQFLFPNSKVTLCVGNTYVIKWKANYINKFFLEYSTDNGNSWRKVALGSLTTDINQYYWKVPDRRSEECLLRLKAVFNNQTIAVTPSVFSIDSCTGIGSVENALATKQIIKSAEYKYAENTVTIYIDQDVLSSLASYLDLEIVDINGKVIYSEKNLDIREEVVVNRIKLSSGVYYITVRTGGFQQTTQLVVVN